MRKETNKETNCAFYLRDVESHMDEEGNTILMLPVMEVDGKRIADMLRDVANLDDWGCDRIITEIRKESAMKFLRERI